MVLDKMMTVAEDLYQKVKEQKGAVKLPEVVGAKKKKKFKDMNPW